MAMITNSMTTEELLAMPENGMERWLIQGELRERPMTTRNRFHSFTMTGIATELETWRRKQTEPRGQILTGDAGIRLQKNPDTTFGVDVVYISAELLAQQADEATIIDGNPTLAVEILSPSDTVKSIDEKIDAFLNAGVPLIWILHPYQKTVTIYSNGKEPELLNLHQVLSGDPYLPGFSVPVRQLFQ